MRRQGSELNQHHLSSLPDAQSHHQILQDHNTQLKSFQQDFDFKSSYDETSLRAGWRSGRGNNRKVPGSPSLNEVSLGFRMEEFPPMDYARHHHNPPPAASAALNNGAKDNLCNIFRILTELDLIIEEEVFDLLDSRAPIQNQRNYQWRNNFGISEDERLDNQRNPHQQMSTGDEKRRRLRLLQDSLGGNSKTVMIADTTVEETLDMMK